MRVSIIVIDNDGNTFESDAELSGWKGIFNA